ncbi:MAG: MFS transporter [Coxiellaceae bacterium]|nr:MFS transporter [Coxiellaceae bacterium]
MSHYRPLTTITFFHNFVRFLVFPILAGYGLQLKNSTPEMLGVIVGVFGLTQAIMLIPMAKLAKSKGVKASLAFGFIVFAVGSVLAAMAESVQGLAVGRAVAGAGAVSSVLQIVMSQAPHTAKKLPKYTKVTLFAFAIAMMLSVQMFWGLGGGQQVFLFIAAIGLLSMLLALLANVDPDNALANFNGKFSGGNAIVNLSAFFAYAIFAGTFVVLPINIILVHGVPPIIQIPVYIIAVVIAWLLYLVDMKIVKSRNLHRSFTLVAIVLTAVAMLLLSQLQYGPQFVLLPLILLFFAMMMVESINGLYISQLCKPEDQAGARIMNSVFQFAGVFVGAIAASQVYAHSASKGMFIDLAIIAAVWLLVSFKLPKLPAKA